MSKGSPKIQCRFPESELARLDRVVRELLKTQEPDGYLYTFRTMHPGSPGHKWIGEKRWEKDPDLSHELYDCGHLYEAGVAYFAKHYPGASIKALRDVTMKQIAEASGSLEDVILRRCRHIVTS